MGAIMPDYQRIAFASTLTVMILSFALGSCTAESPSGSAADRKALVDYLIDKTMEREAFSPIKNERLNLDVEAAMRAYEDEVVGAKTEQEMFYALAKLSNARHDRHLSVRGIEGGLTEPELYPGDDVVPPTAPIRTEIDYSDEDTVSFFIMDLPTGEEFDAGAELGDKIVAVNGVDIATRFEQSRPYFRYSTELGYRKKFAQAFPSRTGMLPPEFYSDTLQLTLEKVGGETIDISLPYVDAEMVEWASELVDEYPGFELVADRGAFDLYLNTDDKPVMVIDWHRFNEYLVEDIDWLTAYAAENDLLDHDIIWDGTKSGGGSRGAYAIQRLSPKPFKTTFGNLRISDVIPAFIAEKVKAYEERQLLDGGVPETIDDGTWLIDWLTDDVQKAYEAGQEYSNNVPFKLAHAPKHSDGILQPADVHFRGNMVCLLGPNGGSHLDQFVTIVIDNELCRTIGMQTGGYSNTWEWDEDVTYPGSGRPVIGFMWNIGHTIGPRGQILEGNPSEIDEYIPLTRQNFSNYKAILLGLALEHLADGQ